MAQLYEERPSLGDRSHRNKYPLITEISSSTRKSAGGLIPYTNPPRVSILPLIGPPPMALPTPSLVLAKVPVISPSTVTTSQFRKMSFKEMQQKRVQRLCYNCDEKFSPMHKCANRQLLLLQWDEDLSNSTETRGSNSYNTLEHFLDTEQQLPKEL